MRYYIATKLENHAAHNQLRDKLDELGHEITYDWTTYGPVYKSGLEVIGQVAGHEAAGVIAADVVIMLWPGGRGTHVELGIALGDDENYRIRNGWNRLIIVCSDIEDHHNATTETCAFYHHKRVEMVRSIDEILNKILNWYAGK